MGKRIRRSPQGAACSSARICGHSRRWFCRLSLTVAVQGASSSALESQVRTASMAPLAAFSRFNCSCSDSSFKITDSVRSRPVPTAVNGRALSSVPYRFVIVSRRNAVPSLVRQGWAATGSATLPCRRFSAILQSAWAICAPSGSTIRLPVPSSRLASRMARLPVASAATPSPNCSTAGRRVADGAVLVAGQPQDHAAVQAEQVAGEEAVRHQNAGALQVQAAARAAVQNIHHAAADIADIHAALPDVLIVHVPQAAGKDLLGPTAAAPPAPAAM